MMADAAGIAHAAGCDNNEEARKLIDGLALFDGLGEPNGVGTQHREQLLTTIYLRGMALEDSPGPGCEGRIDENWHCRSRAIACSR